MEQTLPCRPVTLLSTDQTIRSGRDLRRTESILLLRPRPRRSCGGTGGRRPPSMVLPGERTRRFPRAAHCFGSARSSVRRSHPQTRRGRPGTDGCAAITTMVLVVASASSAHGVIDPPRSRPQLRARGVQTRSCGRLHHGWSCPLGGRSDRLVPAVEAHALPHPAGATPKGASPFCCTGRPICATATACDGRLAGVVLQPDDAVDEVRGACGARAAWANTQDRALIDTCAGLSRGVVRWHRAGEWTGIRGLAKSLSSADLTRHRHRPTG